MTDQPNALRLRTLPKDVGVALVVLVALGLGLLLYLSVDGRTRLYQSADTPFRITYPARWIDAESLQDVLLKVVDPRADSAFKTALTVESRELDPQSPPTLQTLLDRRVEQRSALTGYHFLANQEATIGGEKAMRFDYAYMVQPIDEPRRASLPVVVVAREYIVVTQDHTYYITLAAPENESERAGAMFDRIIQTVQVL
jgi:hypothetical protein